MIYINFDLKKKCCKDSGKIVRNDRFRTLLKVKRFEKNEKEMEKKIMNFLRTCKPKYI